MEAFGERFDLLQDLTLEFLAHTQNQELGTVKKDFKVYRKINGQLVFLVEKGSSVYYTLITGSDKLYDWEKMFGVFNRAITNRQHYFGYYNYRGNIQKIDRNTLIFLTKEHFKL